MKPVLISKLSYADDTNLISHLCLFSNSACAKNMKMEEISENINNELISISEWLNIDKPYLNIKKTKFMLFHYHQHNINSLTPKLAINSEPIERATECNFFGLTIDGHLSWTPHIQKITNKQGKSEGFESCDRLVVQKRPIWVKISDVLYRVTLKFDGWPWKTIGHLSFAVSSFAQHFIAIGEFKLELQSANAQFGSNSTIFRAVWPCNLTYDLEKQ